MELETSVNRNASFIDWKIGSGSHPNLASGFSIDYGDWYCNSSLYSGVPTYTEDYTEFICCSTGKPILIKAKIFQLDGGGELEDGFICPAMLFVLIRTVKQVKLDFGSLPNQEACVICAIFRHSESQHIHTTPCRLEPQILGLFLISSSKI